jgi:galactose mutarotase-like enzyme
MECAGPGCEASSEPAYTVSTPGGTPVVTWSSGGTACSVCPARGCDLVSLALLASDGAAQELLHRGLALAGSAEAATALVGPPQEASEWIGHGQTLFPAVGRHKGGVYAHPAAAVAGATAPLPMPLHGFAMHQPFTVVQYPTAAAPALTCELLGPEGLTQEQRALYPFAFSLRITHALSREGALTVSHTVTNRAQQGALPFALGNHISFAVPFFASARLSGTVTREHTLAPGSLLSGAVVPRGEFSAPGGCTLDTPGVLDGVCGGGAAVEGGVGEGGPTHLS